MLLVLPTQFKLDTTGLVSNVVFQGMGSRICRRNPGYASPHDLYEIGSPGGQCPRIAWCLSLTSTLVRGIPISDW